MQGRAKIRSREHGKAKDQRCEARLTNFLMIVIYRMKLQPYHTQGRHMLIISGVLRELARPESKS